MQIDAQKNIIIVGTSGSGKTTLAKRIARESGRLHIHLDDEFWLPDWKNRPYPEFLARLAKLMQASAWVMDGNYTKARELTWAKAHIIIWLDYPFLLILGRILARTCLRVISRESICGGNKETFAQSFLSKHSVIWWMLTSYYKNKKVYKELLVAPQNKHLRVYHLRHPKELEKCSF